MEVCGAKTRTGKTCRNAAGKGTALIGEAIGVAVEGIGAAEAVERGERDLFTDAEGPFVIPLWLSGMAQRIRALAEKEESDG